MGTNYYLLKDTCQHCGKPDEKIHIGKSSCGWCFALRVTDDIKNLSDWKKLFRNHSIIDEYGCNVSTDRMMEIITCRHSNNTDHGPFYDTWEEFHIRNNSEPGPNNLVRSKIDGSHCVGHGDGTWDLITGEFS